MKLDGRNVPCKQYCASGLQHHLIIGTEDVTAAGRTFQRLRICSRDTIASSSSSNPGTSAQLVVMFDSVLAASINHHRDRHHGNAVISMPVSNLHEVCPSRQI